MADDRVLLLEGVHNFRDFGGYGVSGGGRLKSGRLWRSGQHRDATDRDLAKIAALGLAAVYDLRSNIERERHPCRRAAGFAAAIHYSDDPVGRIAPHLDAAAARRQRDAASTREAMRRNYEGMPFRPELLAMVRRMLSDLASGEKAVLVNCMAGKDRTGMAVAAVHLAAGVHRDDVIADYLLTNTAGDPEARIRAGAAAIAMVTDTIDDDALRVLMGVEAEYLDTAFAAIRERCGSEAAWLENAVGVDAATLERLRAELIEH